MPLTPSVQIFTAVLIFGLCVAFFVQFLAYLLVFAILVCSFFRLKVVSVLFCELFPSLENRSCRNIGLEIST